MAASRRSHVHFVGIDNRRDSYHEADIIVSPTHRGTWTVNLGFVQKGDVYQIEFETSDALAGQELTFNPLQNQYLRLMKCQPTETGHSFVFELSAFKGPKMDETFILVNENSTPLTLIIRTKVLQKQQGHSSLRRGVVFLRREVDSDAEDSEWVDFEHLRRTGLVKKDEGE